MEFKTAAEIINDAAIDLGLISTALADPYDSTSASIIRLRHLLKGVGNRLVRAHDWAQLLIAHEFSTVAETSEYAVPAGMNRIVSGTMWNRTQKRPIVEVATEQQWHQLDATSLGSAMDLHYQLKRSENKVELWPTPSAAEDISYSYVWGYWAYAAATDSDEPTDGADELAMDPSLLVAALKLEWLSATGFPTDHATQVYNEALSSALKNNQPAPVLSISPRHLGPLAMNVPDTGLGS